MSANNNNNNNNQSTKPSAPEAAPEPVVNLDAADVTESIDYQEQYLKLVQAHAGLVTQLADANKKYKDMEAKFGVAANNSRILENRTTELTASYARDKSKNYFRSATKIVSCITSIHNALLVLHANTSGYAGKDSAVKALVNSSEIFLSLITNSMSSINVSIISPSVLDQFDAQYHNILNVTKADDIEKVNKIASVVAIGYRFDDGITSMLIQPAHVLVYI